MQFRSELEIKQYSEDFLVLTVVNGALPSFKKKTTNIFPGFISVYNKKRNILIMKEPAL